MNAPINLNFTQMVSPGGTAPAAGGTLSAAEFGGALLSQLPGAALGFVTGGPVGAGISLAKGLFSMVVNNGAAGENSAEGGKNIPLLDAANPLDTIEDSLSALQNVLTGLFVGEQTQAGAITDKATGQLLDPAVAEAAPAFTGKTLDAYRAAAGLTANVQGGQADPNVAGSAGVDVLVDDVVTDNTLKTNSTEQSANLLAKMQQKSDALAAAGSNSGDSISKLAAAGQANPEGLAESVRKLKNLSAMTPIPSAYGFDKSKQDGNAQAATPLGKLADIQQDIAPVKPQVDKLLASDDGLNQPQVGLNQQSSSHAASQPVVINPEEAEGLVKPLEVKSSDAGSADDLIGVNAGKGDNVQKPDAAQFAQHLYKTANASPMEQVIAKLTPLPEGKQQITIQLEPESLGKVNVKVEWSPDGKTHISIAADRKETLDALKADASSLTRALADTGIKADASNLQFSMRGQGQEFTAGAFADHKGSQSHNQASSNGQPADKSQEIADSATLARSLHINGLLDLHV